MFGARRKYTLRYYVCQPARRRTNPTPPTGHPAAIYVPETALLDGVTDFLTTAVYGPERAAYWRQVLSTPAPDHTNSAQARIAELEDEIASLCTRSRSQVLMLEDEHTPLAARREIATRIAELQATITQRDEALATLRQETPAPPPDPGQCH